MAKSILITGCSSGIGLAVAKTLQSKGYQVFATARSNKDVDLLKSQGFISLPLDVTEPASIQQALTQILAMTHGTLDALFNNAGITIAGAIEDLTPEMLHKQFATNVFGPMEVIRQVLPIMRKQGHGRIIQNSSILGIVTIPYSGAYNASKFAIEGFSHTLRQELRGTNIHVSCLCPGPIKSKLRDHAFEYYKQQDFSQSVHQHAYKKLETYYFDPKNQESNVHTHPDALVKNLLHALESKNPRTHYYVGFMAKSLAFMRAMLPDKILDFVISRAR